MIDKYDVLWESYNLREQNPDIGGGVLYAIRYDFNILNDKREQIITELNRVSEIKQSENSIYLVPRDKNKSLDCLGNLAEKLSVLNDAIYYCEMGFEWCKSVEDLTNYCVKSYLQVLEENDLENSKYLINILFPDLITRLSTAHLQNKVLSKTDLKNLKRLESLVLTFT